MEYRLVHKKNGTYVLQVKKEITIVDYSKGGAKYKTVWENVETKEE